VREAPVGVDPGDHENGEALVDEELDEALRRGEIEDVEFVDPRRHDQQRQLAHFFRRRRILDELQKVILVDDLARRGGEIAPDLERARVCLADAEEVAGAAHVLGEVGHTLHEVLGVALQRLAQHLGVGHGEVRRRQRARHLTQIELGLLPRALVEPLSLVEEVIGPT
jgi:hypothetical protein